MRNRSQLFMPDEYKTIKRIVSKVADSNNLGNHPITFTIISSSFTQLMTSPMLEFSFRSESFISDLDSRFKTHSLTPSDDVFVKAMFF